jgi:hypothetical protein
MKPLKGRFSHEDHSPERKARRESRRELRADRARLWRYQALLEATRRLMRAHIIFGGFGGRRELEAEAREVARQLKRVQRALESPR